MIYLRYMTRPLNFTLFEKILIVSGLLFFANALWIASGGGFELLYVAKGVYLLGIVILATEL